MGISKKSPDTWFDSGFKIFSTLIIFGAIIFLLLPGFLLTVARIFINICIVIIYAILIGIFVGAIQAIWAKKE
jgi:uncharacterized YccA/Bax inhibitor family protein